MIQKFVIIKALCGKPLKRIFMSAEDDQILIVDPERLAEVQSGEHSIASVSFERVFNFDEDAYHELLCEWRMSKETNHEAWTRLGHLETANDIEDSCPNWA
jgi:hypothetical protein